MTDERGPAQQGPANSMIRATLTYTEARTVLRLKLERLDKALTRAFGTVYYPDDSMLRIRAFYRNGKTKVTDATYSDMDGSQVFRRGVTSKWNYQRDVLTISFNNERNDPKPWNRRAQLDAFTVMKKAMHGPHCEIDEDFNVVPCNDDWVSARLKR
jgi:hypothetical protein